MIKKPNLEDERLEGSGGSVPRPTPAVSPLPSIKTKSDKLNIAIGVAIVAILFVIAYNW